MNSEAPFIAQSTNLTLIPSVLHDQARKALAERNIIGFLVSADNTKSLEIVRQNRFILTCLGMFEKTLLTAYTMSRANNMVMLPSTMSFLFRYANRTKLREAGAPFPASGPYTLYRGVAGRGRARRVRGFSWTSSIARAQWFAARAFNAGLEDPAVFQITVPKRAIFAYCNDREEEEYIVEVPPNIKPRRVRNIDCENFPT